MNEPRTVPLHTCSVAWAATRRLLLGLAASLASPGALAVPLLFTLTLTEDTPVPSIHAGTFTVDPADVAALPPTGTAFSPRVTSIDILIAGIGFDVTPAADGGPRAPAADGQASGITGITTNFGSGGFTSSLNPGWAFEIHTRNGLPTNWAVSLNAVIQHSGGIVGDNTRPGYAIAAVPEPATASLVVLAIMGARRLRRAP